jgi:Icc-related predicted phosphoesterase
MQSTWIYSKFLLFLISSFLFLNAFAQSPKVYDTPLYPTGWNKPTALPDRIILNASEQADTKVNVTWRTDTTVLKGYVEVVEIDIAPKFWRNATSIEAATNAWDGSEVKLAQLKAHYHSAELTQLKPGTSYVYRVGNGNYWSEWFQFKTVHKKEGGMKMLFIGDVQNNILDIGSRLLRQAYQHHGNADLLLYSGDLINYAHKDAEWEEWFKMGGFIHSTIPSVMTPGNHEYNPATVQDEQNNVRILSSQWKPQFSLPKNGPQGLEESVYFVDYPLVRVVCLNTNIDSEEQITWLESTLANNTKKWTIVFFHHPVYPTVVGRTDTRVGEILIPILEKHKVDLVLMGHDHAYSRGRSKNTALPVYVVSMAGAKMYNVNKSWEDFGGIRQRVGENIQLYQSIEITQNKIDFTSYLITGQVYDQFRIEKKKDKPKFIELSKGIPEKLHSNTTSYYDKLPTQIEQSILNKYDGYRIVRVVTLKKQEVFQYDVLLRKQNNTDIKLLLSESGEIISEN